MPLAALPNVLGLNGSVVPKPQGSLQDASVVDIEAGARGLTNWPCLHFLLILNKMPACSAVPFLGVYKPPKN